MLIRTLCILGLAVSISACNLTDRMAGSAQKGPFKEGATVYLYSLDYEGYRDGYDEDDRQVSDDQGRFSFKNVSNGWIELRVSGRYFNEYTGSHSDEALALDAITEKDSFNDKANINLFTHLAAARILERLRDGRSIYNAWSRAQTDLREVFGLKRVTDDIDRGSEELSVLGGEGGFSEDNANLLLFSGAFLAIDGDATKLLLLADDFADDGRFNGVGEATFDEIAVAAGEAGLLTKLSNNLKANGAENPPNEEDMLVLPDWVQ